ncbi:SAM-dependent methyltransferase YafE (UbiE paralog) [Rhodovastum atsumiense]|uniref:Class I SAM-dependent methyltransferase n=1 Tax=Rhodovastum atsumiense TaxID=504468 RepID=A0A5M6IZU7_9PROT|nr:class I SAM-dependent methyltransferase [Rhodovastum atsumiense]KAA5613870.1 class I SAM-dependent methyltransferase [Rhodovastum atsumiense]CAH2601992.1 SAM-dependent methyltransferase YafE (UbiE paralog) [Rhodovastum atsumiense]
MSTSGQNYVAAQYAPRAQDYVTSAVHSGGEDLDQIEAALRGQGAARVLDLGCGGGHVSYRVAPHVAHVVACDVTATMLEAVAATAAGRGLGNISVQQAAAERLPFAEACFDVVLCRFTTHHWQDMEAGLREARRVLKPGGRAIFVDVVASADRTLDTHLQTVELLRDVSHVRDYSLVEWVAALARAGFAVEGVTLRRLRMEFPVWVARTRTPPLHAQAIRSLQDGAPVAVRAHFAIGADGSFDIEAATLVVRAG